LKKYKNKEFLSINKMVKKSKRKVSKKKVSEKISPKEKKRRLINKRIFFGSWIAWFVVMVPMYWPNKCAALFDSLLHASFECPTVSLIISLILGSLFMAFLTWIIGWIVVWLYFYHKELTWKNIKQFFKE
jgi:VIT1/CCC1 family predicted Fe2+/Mn2+ transporter|tara:strand:- start:111 stop:500 length:390 start_codon:yes stop_codon:yes gene_type:complete